ncbi:hypothetical protein QR680_012831 [Steinernema hermaphroditum]|uniref:Uncharacterized protein n=1 Tax=Steinernema hermaphroditum TaxID=289476 RepID=A0AA39M1G7_9BILA|nr:hypothetical protein QR680_012831 [Steinernema hermaphroditum]
MRTYPAVVSKALVHFADDTARAREDMRKALRHKTAAAEPSVIPVDAQGKRVQSQAPKVTYEEAKANEKRHQKARAEFKAFQATIHAPQGTAPQQCTSVLRKKIKVESASQEKTVNENPAIADLLSQMRQMESEENTVSNPKDAVQQGMDFLRSQMEGYTQGVEAATQEQLS